MSTAILLVSAVCVLGSTPSRADAPLRLETWGAHRKSLLLAEVAERPVEIVGPKNVTLSSNDLETA